MLATWEFVFVIPADLLGMFDTQCSIKRNGTRIEITDPHEAEYVR